eukprot:snap_masked-scaffold_2-processed-gene-0.27-mRNA-1 protein AED:1.00 eAED:1.00 QI:0/-1/0/0/-1/1/1/0/409
MNGIRSLCRKLIEEGNTVNKNLFEERLVENLRGLYATQTVKNNQILFEYSLTKQAKQQPLICFRNLLERLKAQVNNKAIEKSLNLLNSFALKFPDYLAGFHGTVFSLLVLMSSKYVSSNFYKEYLKWFPSEEEIKHIYLIFQPEYKINSLKGSSIYNEYKIFFQNSRKFFETNIKQFFPEDDIWNKYIYCCSIVQSYSFTIENNEQKNIFLIPLMDAFNADEDKNNVRLFIEEREKKKVLVCKTIKTVKDGEQFYNTFGIMNTYDRYLKYGYIEEKDEVLVNFTINQTMDSILTKKMEKEKRVELIQEIWDSSIEDLNEIFFGLEKQDRNEFLKSGSLGFFDSVNEAFSRNIEDLLWVEKILEERNKTLEKIKISKLEPQLKRVICKELDEVREWISAFRIMKKKRKKS